VLTTQHPLSAKVDTSFADGRWSLGRYCSIADTSNGVYSFYYNAVYMLNASRLKHLISHVFFKLHNMFRRILGVHVLDLRKLDLYDIEDGILI
jgi:hypothetical protein